MRRDIGIFWSGVFLLVLSTTSLAEPVERRRDQFGRDFGYYVYPIAGEIPGLGKASGAGASVLNMGDGDADLTGYIIRGDFKASGLALLDYHLIPQRLIFDVGYNDFLVAPIQYQRGIASDPQDTIQPKVEGKYVLGQVTLTYDERRYEVFARLLNGRQRLLSVLDKSGQSFPNIDSNWKRSHSIALGGSIDRTDDRLDPRSGLRFEFASKLPQNSPADYSEFYVNDYNFTGYLPMRKWDTLAFNVFHSHAYISRQGLTDYATIQQRYGLNCSQYADPAQQSACLAAETQLIDGYLAYNLHGIATSLGGTQRLRSYDNGRFYAGQSLSYGVEYRWNLTDERTPFNIYVAKGIRTGIQLAAFWERGMVADRFSDLFKDGRNSYGVGARMVLSGVVIRFDLAQGNEGAQSQLFITYPWSMFSVDNPN